MVSPKRALFSNTSATTSTNLVYLSQKEKNLFNSCIGTFGEIKKFNFFVHIAAAHHIIKEVQHTVVAIERKAEQSNKST